MSINIPRIKTITLFKVMLWVPGNTKAKNINNKETERGKEAERGRGEREREGDIYCWDGCWLAVLLSCWPRFLTLCESCPK